MEYQLPVGNLGYRRLARFFDLYNLPAPAKNEILPKDHMKVLVNTKLRIVHFNNGEELAIRLQSQPEIAAFIFRLG